MKYPKKIILLVFWVIIGILLANFGHERKILQNHINTYWHIDFEVLKQERKDNNISFKRFGDVLNVLNAYYYDQSKLETGAMMESAVKAYVDGVDDPYTIYLDAVQQSGFKAALKGEEDFEGIGAVVRKKEYYVLIEEVIKDSPAFKAGLKPLDRIILVDTGSVKGMTIDEAVAVIKWPQWTKVLLVIERVDRQNLMSKEYLEIEVIRDKLLIPSVMSKIIESNGKKFGYIDLALIGEETENIFEQQALELLEQNIDGIILDVRGNGGGLLEIAVQIVSHFVAKDKLVVSAKYRVWEDESYKSIGYGTFEGLPVVVLINDMTASAGEIIALALQEQVGAKLIWTTTFGKGSIQTLNIFDNGDSIKYTIGMRFPPSGKSINKTGIKPDIELNIDIDAYVEDAYDNQLEKAKEILGEQL